VSVKFVCLKKLQMHKMCRDLNILANISSQRNTVFHGIIHNFFSLPSLCDSYVCVDSENHEEDLHKMVRKKLKEHIGTYEGYD